MLNGCDGGKGGGGGEEEGWKRVGWGGVYFTTTWFDNVNDHRRGFLKPTFQALRQGNYLFEKIRLDFFYRARKAMKKLNDPAGSPMIRS